MSQLDLLAWEPPIPPIHFQGGSYDVEFDCTRLNNQMRDVHEVMKDGAWRTLRQISDATGHPEASVSARLRDFNNNEYLKQFFVMISERIPGLERRGVWRYSVRRRGQ